MNKQFTWSSAGVAAWQANIYQHGQSAVDQECTWVLNDFVAWISYRFSLDDAQISFLMSLGPLAQESYATSVANTLQHGGNISLEKDEVLDEQQAVKSQKVIVREERLQRRQEKINLPTHALDPDYTVSLRFHIYYSDQSE